jgi:hypothetical protein
MDIQNKLNRDVNKVTELEKKVKRGLCDPSFCSGLCYDCPFKLREKEQKRRKR